MSYVCTFDRPDRIKSSNSWQGCYTHTDTNGRIGFSEILGSGLVLGSGLILGSGTGG